MSPTLPHVQKRISIEGKKVDMPSIIFEVLGDPKAQKRHRDGKGYKFDPSQNAKRDFLLSIQHNAPIQPIDGPIEMRLQFFMLRPKSHFGTGKNRDTLKQSAPSQYINVPDLDNLEKFVLDAMNKIFFRDDKLVWKLTKEKLYADNPKTIISMQW